MKKILLLAALLLVPSLANAQTASLVYEYNRALTEVNTYTQQVLIDNVVLATVPTCVATSASLTTCTVAAPTLATGTHTVRINATLGSVTASTIITGIGGPTTPANPTNPKITILITIGS